MRRINARRIRLLRQLSVLAISLAEDDVIVRHDLHGLRNEAGRILEPLGHVPTTRIGEIRAHFRIARAAAYELANAGRVEIFRPLTLVRRILQ
jgi:hypothetical protein